MKRFLNLIYIAFCAMVASFKEGFTNMAYFERSNESPHYRKLHSKIMHLQHFDEDFEEFEEFDLENVNQEYFETVEKYKRKGQPDSMATRNARNAMVARQKKKKTAKALRAGAPLRSLDSGGGLPTTAVIVVTIQRRTNAIAAALPVVLFAAIHQYDQYNSLLTPYLPAGCTVAVTNNAGNLRFTFTSGANVDIVDVVCTSIPFLTLLNATLVNMFVINRVRYTLGAVDQLLQFDQVFDSTSKTMFGTGGGRNPIPISTFRDPKNYQSGIIDAAVKLDVDQESGIVVGMYNYVQTVTLNLNISRSDSRNRKRLQS